MDFEEMRAELLPASYRLYLKSLADERKRRRQKQPYRARASRRRALVMAIARYIGHWPTYSDIVDCLRSVEIPEKAIAKDLKRLKEPQIRRPRRDFDVEACWQS